MSICTELTNCFAIIQTHESTTNLLDYKLVLEFDPRAYMMWYLLSRMLGKWKIHKNVVSSKNSEKNHRGSEERRDAWKNIVSKDKCARETGDPTDKKETGMIKWDGIKLSLADVGRVEGEGVTTQTHPHVAVYVCAYKLAWKPIHAPIDREKSEKTAWPTFTSK